MRNLEYEIQNLRQEVDGLKYQVSVLKQKIDELRRREEFQEKTKMNENKEARARVTLKLIQKVKQKFPETKGMTATGLVDWALRYLLKLKQAKYMEAQFCLFDFIAVDVTSCFLNQISTVSVSYVSAKVEFLRLSIGFTEKSVHIAHIAVIDYGFPQLM